MKKKFTFLMAAIVLLTAFAIPMGMWGQVVSGTIYSTPSTSNLPTGWTGSDGSGSTYIKLIASSHYIQTSAFGQNGFTSIVVKARKFGGPSNAQALISVSWYDASTSAETVLGTIAPENTTLKNYTISSPNNPTGNTNGYVKIQCKGASDGKGSGVSEVTINYTAITPAGPTVDASVTSLTGFSYAVGGGPSASQSFNVSGSTLGSNNLVVTASSNYEVCKTDEGSYTSYVEFTPSEGSVAATPVYVRLRAGLEAGSYASADNKITVSSTGATSKTVALSGNVLVSYSVTCATGLTHGSISADKTSAVEGETVTITATPDDGYQLSTVTATNVDESDITIAGNTATFAMPANDVTVSATFAEKTEVYFDFTNIDGFDSWTNSYDKHEVDYAEATVTFYGASKQTTTITNMPVTKGSDVTIIMKSGQPDLTGATFVCEQWGTKTQTITLHKSTDGGTNYTTTGTTSSNFSITNNNLPDGTNAVMITFSNSSNQVGIKSATLRFAPKYDITLASVSNGTIAADKTEASAGQIVTLTATPNIGYALSAWDVYKTGESGTKVTVDDNNQFVMPDYAVTVSATFAASYTLTYSVNGVTSTADYAQGATITLPTPTENIPTRFSFLGWTENANNVNTLLTSYTVNSAATLYAVFGKVESITLVGTDFGTYSDTEVIINGVHYGVTDVMKNTGSGNPIQMKSGTGCLYNKGAFANLLSIVTTQTGTHRDVTLKGGDSEKPTDGTTIDPSTNGLVDTYNISGNYDYFVLTNTSSNALYYSSIVFNFGNPNGPRYVNVIPTDEIATADIEITGPTLIESGSVLNMGTYTLVNDNPANLVIEDGGQLICSNSVAATVKKTIESPASKVYGWYTISAPVHTGSNNYVTIGASTTVNLTNNGAYDMFAYDESTHNWLNQKSGSGATGFDKMYAGQGYMYRNSGNELSFVGNTTVGPVNIALSYTSDLDVEGLRGFNLIGNPYTHSIAKGSGKAIDNSNLSTGCYALTNSGTWTPITDGDEILPEQGILVEVSKAVAYFQIQDINYSGGGGSKYHNDNIKFTISNNSYEDVAYAWFDKGIGLTKINHRDENAPMLYIPQEGKNYAIATMSDDTKVFGLNFKAATMGQYTLSYKADGNFDYLHIIDRLTGKDIDMLLEGQFTFMANKNDSENRFIVKLGYSPDYSEGNNDIFAYQTGSEILVSGSGELQIFDVTGRKVMTTTINGAESISVTAPGIYIFRLIGTEVKTQKIVVR